MRAIDHDAPVLERPHVDEIAGREHRLHAGALAPQRCKARRCFIFSNDPCAVAAYAHHSRRERGAHDLIAVTRKISFALDAFSQLVFRLHDPRARAAVRDALQGRGKPAGIRACDEDEGTLTVSFDANITAPARCRVRDLDDAALARLVAEATEDPELDENRILEHLVPELAE